MMHKILKTCFLHLNNSFFSHGMLLFIHIQSATCGIITVSNCSCCSLKWQAVIMISILIRWQLYLTAVVYAYFISAKTSLYLIATGEVLWPVTATYWSQLFMFIVTVSYDHHSHHTLSALFTRTELTYTFNGEAHRSLLTELMCQVC